MKKIIFVLAITMLVASCGSKKGSKEVLAVVDGSKITLGDLQEKYPDLEKQLFRMEENMFRYKEMYLNDMIDNKVIELEAKKTKKNPAELVTQEVSSKIKPVTDEEVVAFGKEKGVTPDQMSKFKDRIKQYLAAQREAEARKNFAKTLRDKYKVTLKIKKPKGKVVEIKVSDDDASKGSKSAKVTVVEFSDFQCPFCKRASSNYDSIVKAYGDKVRVVFKHFPLPMHEMAHKAAEAAQCMNDQGKFFEYHDKLFANNTALAEADLKKYVTEVGGDVAKFTDCLTKEKYKAKVDKDMADGQKYGVSGAPTYFINGNMIVGAVSFDELKQAIDGAMNE